MEHFSQFQVPVSTTKKLCPKSGVFPYENDCQTFYKCKRTASGKMQGKTRSNSDDDLFNKPF